MITMARLLSFLVMLVACGSAAWTAELSRDDIYARVAPSYLEARDDSGATTRANGFFARADVAVVPFYLVKDGTDAGKEVTATVPGREEKYPIKQTLATDQDHGMALLWIPGTSARPLTLGNSDLVKVGSSAYILGNHIFKNGTISKDASEKEKLILTASVSPGSAGSPVVILRVK